MNKYFLFAAAAVVSIASTSCNNDDDSSTTSISKASVIANYSNIVYANYSKAYEDAVTMENVIGDFTMNPTEAGFQAAKDAWKTARESYLTTEAFRFSNGPIDDSNGPEGLINSWPLDENYIDYVDGNPSAGIINDLTATISKATLTALNQQGENGEKNITTGYHAIEFLLWGQDLTAPSELLPGQRPYTDFVTGSAGTHENQDRRALYLRVCADLLTDNLAYLVDQWKPGGTYRQTFLSLDPNTALTNIYTGIVTLAQTELAIERMNTALFNQDQEDEQSCFSDNTHRDIRQDLQGIVNVYSGTYGSISGPSLADLAMQADQSTATQVNAALNDAVAKMAMTGIPFDNAVSGGATTAEGSKIKQTVTALQDLGATLLASATKIGISVTGI